jgi:hypothetical protein
MAHTYKTLSISLPPGVVQELHAIGQSTNRTGARVAAQIVLREVAARSMPREDGCDENRRRLTGLVVAGTKLDVAMRLVREALVEIGDTELLPSEGAQGIVLDIEKYLRRVTMAITLIP